MKRAYGVDCVTLCWRAEQFVKHIQYNGSEKKAIHQRHSPGSKVESRQRELDSLHLIWGWGGCPFSPLVSSDIQPQKTFHWK